ncbi:MAG: prephenate dehydratase domain-containing protein, partial [Pseudomonadota bacterium]
NPSALKENARLAILGEKGSYSYFAGKKYFARRSRECVEIGCKSFLDVIKKVEEKDADYGVLPFENSASGSINEVYDHLQHTQLHIVGEITETIEHNLLVCAETTIDDIQTLYAHPQVFAQCSYMLTELDNVEVKPCDNTSAAMRKVQTLQSSNVAAIGPAQGGRYYDLSPIQSNLMHQNQNHSRFIIVARDSIKVPLQIPAKTTLIMSTVQTPGALVDALLVLKNHQIALTKLESRPTPGNPWEEMFYVDMHGNITDGPMQDALAELSSMTKYLKVLGCYPIESVAPTRISVAEQ